MTNLSPTRRRSKWARIRDGGLTRFVLRNLATVYLPASIAVAVISSLWLYVQDAPLNVTVGMALGTLGFAVPIFLLLSVVSYFEGNRTFEQRIREGRCTSCEYDLRGSIEAGKDECPECGSQIEKMAPDPWPARGERI